ncbi:hypothetical protein [uncultured Gammaproteobacteria bacterium]|nr:hypothetical protein [uncultured Gammaproteobacteria bacterium]
MFTKMCKSRKIIHHHTGGLENSEKIALSKGKIHHHTGGLENPNFMIVC